MLRFPLYKKLRLRAKKVCGVRADGSPIQPSPYVQYEPIPTDVRDQIRQMIRDQKEQALAGQVAK